MADAAKLLGLSESKRPTLWIRLPRSRRPKAWDEIQDPVVPLERNVYGLPLAGLLWERQFEKVLVETGGENVAIWGCLFVLHEKGLFLSVHVDDKKMEERRST